MELNVFGTLLDCNGRRACHGFHAPFPPLMARQMTSAVAGISICFTPNSDSASMSALATAGIAPTVPASPAPLTPSGLVLVGTGLLLIAIAGRSLARGMA